jgi:RNA polymerase sigma-70 factor (ECF subfamily)
MTADEPSSIQTRPSLLNRLKSGDDSESWNEFYRVYGKLIRDFALHAGLNDTEADEVVQETAIAISRHLSEFRYDPKVCRFKTWLLNQSSWRIKDQLKKRRRSQKFAGEAPAPPKDDSTRTDTIHRVPDPASVDLEALFETQWRQSLLTLALDRVKERFSLKQFQVFDLLVNKEWPAADVAKALGISVANVYVTRHRISTAITKDVKLLEKELERKVASRAGPASHDDRGRVDPLA